MPKYDLKSPVNLLRRAASAYSVRNISATSFSTLIGIHVLRVDLNE